MSEPIIEPTEPVTEPVGQEPTEPATGTPPEPAPVTEPTPTEGIDDLPDHWQKEIKRLRAEAGKDRTKAKEQAAKEAREAALTEAEAARKAAVDQAIAEQNQKLAKALGLVKEDEQLTPEQLLEKAQQERDAEKTAREERDAKYRDLLLEVAVQDAANMHDARADRLLDSRAFMKKVRGIDPDGEGYRAAIAEAVAAAVEADDDMKAAKKPAPPSASGGTTVAGSRTRDIDDMSIEEMISAGFTKRR